MRNICFITNNVNQYGGIERVYSQLVCIFTEQLHYRVCILSLFSHESHPFFELPSYVCVYHAGLILGDNIGDYISSFLLDNKVTHIVTFHPTIGLSLSRISRHNVIWVATEHNAPTNYTHKRRLANLYAYMHADKLVVLTQYAAQYYRRRGLRNVRVIPNPISFTSEQVSPLTAKTIVAVGRLETVKRFDRLLYAFSEVVKVHPDYMLKIVGDGSQENALRSLTASLGIQNSVEFAGVQKNVKDILLDASFLTITSEYEGFTLVALEAMTCGLPIVAFDLPPLREMDAESGCFSFAPQGDCKALAAEMNRLIDNKEQLACSAKAAKSRSAAYGMAKIGSMWKSLFEEN